MLWWHAGAGPAWGARMLESEIKGQLPSGFMEAMGTQGIEAVLDSVASDAFDYWVKLTEDLTSTKVSYTKGIQPVRTLPMEEGSYGRQLALVGAFPNALENGQKAYDMHDTLLGPNVPVVKARMGLKGKHEKRGGGFYRVIPFRHQGPNSAGIHGAAMGRAYQNMLGVKEALALGKVIWREAKKLTATEGEPGGKIRWGSKLPAGLAPKLKEHHHSDIYAGMYKQSKFYEKVTQSSFVTFRTISTGSPGWLRKETPGLHFAPKVKEMVDNHLIKEAFEALFKAAAE